MSQDRGVSRREFLKGAAAAAVVPFASRFANATTTADDPKSLTKIFEGIELTDQYGNKFNPAELYEDKPVVVMFGFGGCQMCQKLSTTAAAVQAEVDARNEERTKKGEPPIELPIIVVSVKPDQDRFKEKEGEDNPMEEYIKSYDNLGVRQFKEKKKRNEPYEDGKAVEQKDRLLHVVTPQTGKTTWTDKEGKELNCDFSQLIQLRLSEATSKDNIIPNTFDLNAEGSHSRYLNIFKNGAVTQAEPAPFDRDENERKGKAEITAKKIVDAALQKETSRAR